MKIMAGNSGKDPAGIAWRSTSISWLVPMVFSLSNMAPAAPEWFFLFFFFFFGGGRGRSGECLVGVRGSVCF